MIQPQEAAVSDQRGVSDDRSPVPELRLSHKASRALKVEIVLELEVALTARLNIWVQRQGPASRQRPSRNPGSHSYQQPPIRFFCVWHLLKQLPPNYRNVVEKHNKPSSAVHADFGG